jgi:hypothetical protein
VFEAMRALNEKDGFRPTEVDEQIAGVHDTQLAGHFLLIDREGIVRWTHVEAGERIADLAKFPGASRRGPPSCGTPRCS